MEIARIFAEISGGQVVSLIISAILIGINKTAVPGAGLLPVVLLTGAFDPRLGAGLQLGMLAAADVMAVIWYRRHADWKLLLKLLPWAVAGLVIGSVIMRLIPEGNGWGLRILIGSIILALIVFSWLREKISAEAVPSGTAAGAFFGILLGVTTQLANAAGPVAAVYFLAMKLPKEKYMGTNAWFFLIINWIKLPIFISEGRISPESIKMDLCMLPFLVAGAAVGILLLKRMNQHLFEQIIRYLALLASLKLILQF